MIDFKLVSPEYVSDCLLGRHSKEHTVVLEANYNPVYQSENKHIPLFKHLPNAIQLHPSYFEAGINKSKYYPLYTCPEDGNLLPRQELLKAVENLGITPGSQVIVYGVEPMGTMAAARVIWALMYAGVSKLRLLDGGIDAWLAYGGGTTAFIQNTDDLVDRGLSDRQEPLCWQVHPEFLATTREVKQIVTSPLNCNSKLVDVRSAGENKGEATRHYSFFSKAGHIPHSIFQGNWDNLLDQNTYKIGTKLEDIRERWRKLGIIDECVEEGLTNLVFYCGTGWRSSVSFLIAILLGLRASNYDDGFYGWSWHDENRVQV